MTENEARVVETDDEELEEEEEADEFRTLFAEAEAEGKRLKVLAMKAEQAGDPASAAVLREVAGGVVQLIQEVIATTGGTFQELNTDSDGSHLEEEDAEKLHGLLLACRKLASEVLSAGAVGDSKQGLETLSKLIDDQLEFILEISDYEPESAESGAN
jgi:hypothetical protein